MKKILLNLLLISITMSGHSQNKNMELEAFNIIGITTETTNANGQSITDIGKLWQQFEQEQIATKIPNIVSNEVFSVFTDYESDYTGAYRVIIGFKVSDLEEIPEGMVGRSFKAGSYTRFMAKGKVPQSIAQTWQSIWKEDEKQKRRYTADYEVYGPKSQQGERSEVDIYIAVE